MKQKHVILWILIVLMTTMGLQPMQAQVQEETSGGAIYLHYGLAFLSNNKQLSKDVTRFGEYALPSLAMAYCWEVQSLKRNKIGLGSYYTILLNDIEHNEYQSSFYQYAAGLRFSWYMKTWERSCLYTWCDLGVLFHRYTFTDNGQPDNVFITDSLFNYNITGMGRKPSVWIHQYAMGLNAGLGYDLFLRSNSPMSIKASLISTPSFPAYRTHDHIRITNLKRFHNLGAQITIGIGIGWID